MRQYLLTGLLGLAVLGAAGCSPDEAAAPAQSTTSATSATSSAPATSPASTEIDGHQTLTAAMVLKAFQAAKLPVRKPRDNSRNCEALQCEELTTTDDISIYTWTDEVAQQQFAEVGGDNVYSSGNVVLQYAAARTPEAMRPKYEKVLDGLK
jgi:hypothetical protein